MPLRVVLKLRILVAEWHLEKWVDLCQMICGSGRVWKKEKKKTLVEYIRRPDTADWNHIYMEEHTTTLCWLLVSRSVLWFEPRMLHVCGTHAAAHCHFIPLIEAARPLKSNTHNLRSQLREEASLLWWKAVLFSKWRMNTRQAAGASGISLEFFLLLWPFQRRRTFGGGGQSHSSHTAYLSALLRLIQTLAEQWSGLPWFDLATSIIFVLGTRQVVMFKLTYGRWEVCSLLQTQVETNNYLRSHSQLQSM